MNIGILEQEWISFLQDKIDVIEDSWLDEFIGSLEGRGLDYELSDEDIEGLIQSVDSIIEGIERAF